MKRDLDSNIYTRTQGNKSYELTDHLGNVLMTITDRKIPVGTAGSAVSYYTANITNATDYYPFGATMPGRLFTSSTGNGYRYGYNGKEQDPETYGLDNEYDYGMRMYNPRLGRFMSVDPLTSKYPMLTPYQFASNKPTVAIDLDGLEAITPFVDPTSSGQEAQDAAPEKEKVGSPKVVSSSQAAPIISTSKAAAAETTTTSATPSTNVNQGASVTLANPYEYIWSNGSGKDNPTQTNQIIKAGVFKFYTSFQVTVEGGTMVGGDAIKGGEAGAEGKILGAGVGIDAKWGAHTLINYEWMQIGADGTKPDVSLDFILKNGKQEVTSGLDVNYDGFGVSYENSFDASRSGDDKDVTNVVGANFIIGQVQVSVKDIGNGRSVQETRIFESGTLKIGENVVGGKIDLQTGYIKNDTVTIIGQ